MKELRGGVKKIEKKFCLKAREGVTMRKSGMNGGVREGMDIVCNESCEKDMKLVGKKLYR